MRRFISSAFRIATTAGAPPKIRNVELRKSSVLSWAPSGWLIDQEIKTVATSFHVIGVPSEFRAVRIAFANDTPNSFRVKGVIVSASASAGDFANPIPKNGWRRITFASNGQPSDEIMEDPAAPGGIDVQGSRTCSSPIPEWTWSDWVPLSSIFDPNDEHNQCTVMVRVLLEANQVIVQPNGSFHGYFAEPKINLGYEYGAGWLPIDCVNENLELREDLIKLASFGRARATIACFQFLTLKPGYTIMTTGDSHQQGTSTTTQFMNFVLRSILELGAKHANRIPFGYVSCAVGGSTSEAAFSRLKRLVPIIKPSLVVLPGWIYNDEKDGINADVAIIRTFAARLMMAAETCRRHGGEPLFTTPLPRDAESMGSSQMEGWMEIREKIMNLRTVGLPVLDGASLVGALDYSGHLTGTYLPESSDDSVHPNDKGHAMIATELTRLLSRTYQL